MTANEILAGVLRLHSAGLAVIPIKTDGSKAPFLSSWKQFEKRLPTEGELRKWFGNGKRQGIALIGGAVSGNLEILDFDAPELIADWREIVEEAAPGLLNRLPQVDTPAGGLHVFYRCAEIAGNKKLAEREVDVPEGTKGARKRDGRWLKIETTIETRGEGGYVITAGSPADCHPSGNPYRLVNGDLKAIPTITEREREILLDCARSFNAHIKRAPEAKRERSEGSSSGLRPGDDFDQRGDIRPLLEKHGWKYLRPGSRGELWQRPGGDHTSATLFPDGSLYVFSSNADPFDHGRVYKPFSIYALLEHADDFKAAAKALAAEGYGDQRKSSKAKMSGPDVDPSKAETEKTSSSNAEPDAEVKAGEVFAPVLIFEDKLRLEFRRVTGDKLNIEAFLQPDELIHQSKIDIFNEKSRGDFAKRLSKKAAIENGDAATIDKALLSKTASYERFLEAEEKLREARIVEHEQLRAKHGVITVGNIAFEVNDDGVWATDEYDTTWVCSQLLIEADTCDEQSVNWGRLLRFPDRKGVWHTWSMPTELLDGDGREFRRYLLNQGLDIGGRKSRGLLETYLNVKPEKFALCVTKPGWHRGGFVLPDEFIAGENAEPIYLQTFNVNHLFRQKGTAKEWCDKVGVFCRNNNRLILAASIAFTAPLLEPLQGESGGWHFTGDTSQGKSTALYVAGSVHGGGGDKGFLRRWRATINGLESVAESHHDSLLCLDEIAECKPDDVNEAAYMLANGQGKARQQRAGGLRGIPEWRLPFLSSGEISIADHIAQSGRRARGGQEVRVINLPADAAKGFGLFDDLHGKENGDAFARYLQGAARNYYGAPIRAFLRKVAGRLDGLRCRYKTFCDELLKEILPAGAIGAVSRVAHRFALAAFAGELATEYGITGWEPDEATGAAKALFATWLKARGTEGSADDEAIIRQVRLFVEQHGESRFRRLDRHDDRIVINRAGYFDTETYYFSREVFKNEACRGFDLTQVTRALDQGKFLVANHGMQFKKHDPETGKTIPFYAVSVKILE